MKRCHYSYEMLFRHSNQVAIDTRRLLNQPVQESRRLFKFLSNHFQAIEAEPRSLVRNVKLILTTRFINHMFAQLLLIERGLLLDAFNCSRAALETTAFYWLVLKDPSAAVLYTAEKALKPVEVRRRLEAAGIEVGPLRELYQFQSGIAHVGSDSDGLQITWEKAGNGRLLTPRNSTDPRDFKLSWLSAAGSSVRFDASSISTPTTRPSAS